MTKEKTKIVGIGARPCAGEKFTAVVEANPHGSDGYAIAVNFSSGAKGYVFQNPKFAEPGFKSLTDLFSKIDPSAHVGETFDGLLSGEITGNKTWISSAEIFFSDEEYNEKVNQNTKDKERKLHMSKNSVNKIFVEGRKRNPWGLNFAARLQREDLLAAGTEGADGSIIKVPVTFENDASLGVVKVFTKDTNDLIGVIVDGDGAMASKEVMKKLDDESEYEAAIVGNERFIRLIAEVSFKASEKAARQQAAIEQLMGAEEVERRSQWLRANGISDDGISEVFGHIAFMAGLNVEGLPSFEGQWDQPLVWMGPATTIMSAIRKFRLGYPILTYGPPSCGKDTLMSTLAALFGYPIVRMTMDENVDSDTLISTTSLVETDKGNVVTAPTKSALMQAMEQRQFLVIDEVNYVAPAQLGALNGPLERPVSTEMQLGKVAAMVESVSTPSGLSVQKHPGFRMAFTLNLGLAGCKQLNDSFWSRTSKLPLEAQMTLSKILGSKFRLSPADLKICEKVWGAIRNHAANVGMEEVTDVGIRDFERAAELSVVCGVEIKEALASEVISSIQDPSMKDGVQKALDAL